MLTAVVLVAEMLIAKFNVLNIFVVEHLSTVAMTGRNFIEGLSYDCYLGNSTHTAIRISESLIHCHVLPSIPGNFSLIGRD